MREHNRFFSTSAFVLAAVLALTPVVVFAADDVPTSPKTEWTVGVAALSVTDATDGAMVSAASLISRLIRSELEGADKHLLNPSERTLLARKVIEEEEMKIWKDLASLYAKRDDFLFDPNADMTDFKDLEIDIEEASHEAMRWKRASPESIVVPRILDIVYPDPVGGGRIWDIGEMAHESFRKYHELDVLVCGNLIRVGDYYGLSISARTADGIVPIWEGAASDTELETVSQEAGAIIRSLVLGRPWCSLTVQADPPEALIVVNGKTMGVGFWSSSVLNPGDFVLEVSAHGFEPLLVEETLTESENKTLSLTLEKTDLNAVLVRSDPPGADVRLGTLWLGSTPLLVERPDRVMPLSLELEDYISRTVPFSPDTEKLTVPLESRLVDPIEEYSIARKKLYNAVAIFSASLAPTIALLGISQNYANMNIVSQESPVNDEDLEYSYRRYLVSYGMMWGSVAVNLGLLTNVLFRLHRYLDAAEGLSD